MNCALTYSMNTANYGALADYVDLAASRKLLAPIVG